MKKTVILILILLPIVLVITIAFAGRILSMYHHIPVEKVDFVDDVGDALDDEYLFIVNVGETKPTAIRIFPEMASNKKVAYTSQNTSLCTVDDDGNITGVSIGSTSILVTTSEGNKTDILNVLVVADHVTGVSFAETELNMILGEHKQLQAIVEPYTALNKNVTFDSSNPSVVSVKPNGEITALQSGEAVITVKTQDGGFSATCTVTVSDGILPLYFDMTGAPNIILAESGTGYIITQSSIDLAPYLRCDTDKVDPTTIHWSIASGNNSATLTGTTLTFTTSKTSFVTVRVYAGDAQAPTCEAKILFIYQP